jgi:hypothetical protein
MLKNSLIIGAAAVLALHGLIHLMGTTVYMQWSTIEGFPYKTTLLGGRWDLGASGVRLFGLMWLLAAVGIVVAGVGLFTHAAWLPPVLLVATLLSLAICTLDWELAWRGAVIDLVILVLLALAPRLAAFFPSPAG